jgi:hypothetical protein
MATAGICSTFNIVISGADLNAAKSLTCPRDLTIVGVSAVNTAAGASTLLVEKISTAAIPVTTTITATTAAPPVAGNGVVQAQAQVGPTCPVSIIAANASVLAGETIRVTTGATTVTQVVLSCIGTLQAITIA